MSRHRGPRDIPTPPFGSSLSPFGGVIQACATTRGLFVVTLTAALLLLGVTIAGALTGLTIAAPSDLTVNSASTAYSASVTAGGLLDTESVTQVVFDFPPNFDISVATVTLSSGTGTLVRDNSNNRIEVQNITGADYGGLASGTFTATVNDVINPSVPGSYTWSVSMTGDNTVSGNRNATYSASATSPNVGPASLANTREWATTTLTVPIGVGPTGRLAADAAPGGVVTPNTITLTFPAAFSMPSSPASSSVTINGVALNAAPVMSGQQVTLEIPAGVNVSNGATATVEFMPSFGMPNPDAGTYSIQAHTDAETANGSSAGLTVTPAPTTLSIATANGPGPAVVLAGETRVVGGFTLERSASSKTVSVGSVVISDSGTSPASNVSAVRVYRDNGDGAYGAGDPLLNPIDALFAGSTADVSFDSPEAIGTAPAQYWIVYGFAAGAADLATATARPASFDTDADAVSNAAAVGSTFTVDALAPVVSIASPAISGEVLFGSIPPYTIAGTATDTVSAVDEVRVSVQRDSDSNWWNGIGWQASETSVSASSADGWATWDYSWSFTPAVQTGEETYTVTASARDAAGLVGSATRTSVRIDNVSPWIVSANAVNSSHVDVVISEAINPATIDPADFSISGLAVSQAVALPDGYTVRLTTDVQEPDTTYALAAASASFSDLPGNLNTAPYSATFTGVGSLVTVASANQPEGTWVRADSSAVVDGFTITRTAGADAAGVRSVTIESSGTATSADIDGVSVYRDADHNGAFSAAEDTLLNGSPATFSSGQATVTFDTTETAGASQQYFVVYHFSTAATNGRTTRATVLSATSDASMLDITTVMGSEFALDTVAPSAPMLAALAVGRTAIDTSWTAAVDDDSGIARYYLRRDGGSLVATNSVTYYRVTGLASGTEYGFYVVAADRAGNVTASEIATASTFSSSSGAMIPHLPDASDTDVCAMCHRSHSAASEVTSVDRAGMRKNALVIGTLPESTGDTLLCFSCHGVEMLGSSVDVQSQFSQGSGHRIAPEDSEYGPRSKQCSDCHDTHGSERTASGSAYPSLLRSRDASGNTYESGDAYCGACHTLRRNNLFPGLAVWRQTAHSRIETSAANGTDIVCSTCHTSHQSPISPGLRSRIVSPSAPATVTVTANDRSLCLGCHATAERTWVGQAQYATSAHGSSTATVAIDGEWPAMDNVAPAERARRVGECQSCHATMGAPDGSGGAIPRLKKAAGEDLCLSCHSAGGAASTNMQALSFEAPVQTASLLSAYSASTATSAFGRLHVFSRDTSGTTNLVGPREYLRGGDVGAIATGDIDGDGVSEVLVARPSAATISVMTASLLSGLTDDPGESGLLERATFLAVGDVLDDVGNVPEIVTANGEVVHMYRWDGTSFDWIDSANLGGTITGLTIGKVINAVHSQVIATVANASGSDSLVVMTGQAGGFVADGTYPTRSDPKGPSIGDLDGDGLAEIAVANSGETSPTVSVFSGTGNEIATAGSSSDASGTATLIRNVLPGLTKAGSSGAEVSLALAAPDGTARLEIFPQTTGGLGSAIPHTFATRSNPSALAAGDLDGDGTHELVVGLSGSFARVSSQAAAPGVAIVDASADGTAIGSVDVRTGGGVELAGATSLAVAKIGAVGPSRHPVEVASAAHVSTETAILPEHVDCADCHNVHRANDASAAAPAVTGPLAGTWGVSVENVNATQVQLAERHGVAYEYEVCLKCHSAWMGPSGRRSIASEFNTRTASFHPVEGPAPATNAVGDTLVGRAVGSYVRCTDCHGNSSGTSPKGPHRSAAAPLLKAPLAGASAGDPDGLCFKCHRRDIYGTGVADGLSSVSGFFDPDLGLSSALHARHTAGGFTCASCHQSHGSATLPYLLRGNLGWEPVPSGGACTSSCHTAGARHEYTR